MSNMYPKTVTWNPLAGECFHKCEYCYREDLMRYPNNLRKYSGEPRFVDVPIPSVKEGEVVFVCSMTDLFAENVQDGLIENILSPCWKIPDNVYLFQSKNPSRFWIFGYLFPPNTILGTTIETNRFDMCKSNAPSIMERCNAMRYLNLSRPKKMVSIEPILDFDVDKLALMMQDISPSYISIGADSKNHNLQEPPKKKVEELIAELQKFTEVRLKKNLNRLLK